MLREINGYTVADRKQVPKYQDLKDDGSTACGAWTYCGIYPRDGHNVARSRTPDGPGGPGSHLGWAFAWPSNRRTMYNRASADPAGQPWSERKKMIWWDEAEAKWTGTDVPDFVETTRPDQRPDWSTHPTGMDALSGADPFIMEPDGRCALFVSTGLKDGPLPTHYEPVESPVHNPMYGQQFNPGAKIWERPGNEIHAPADPRFPYALTTFRLTELHCGGIMSRITPHTAELQPEAFVEVSPELARERGITHMEWATLSTLRGEVEVRAMVTSRVRPFVIDGRTVHQVAMPWVFGWDGIAHGDVTNALLAIHGDPNTSIHTTKALTRCGPGAGLTRMPAEREHALLESELEPGEPGRVALRLLDEMLAGQPERDGARFSACARHLCALRRGVVREDAGGGERLGRLNGVISVVVGGHFPLGKVPWPHLEHARRVLAELVG